MKTKKLLILSLLLLVVTSLFSQTNKPVKGNNSNGETIINARLDIFKGNVHSKLKITELNIGEFDQIFVSNTRGAILLKKTVKTGIANMDVSQLDEGLYLLELRSTSTLNEKVIKILIKR